MAGIAVDYMEGFWQEVHPYTQYLPSSPVTVIAVFLTTKTDVVLKGPVLPFHI
jgi:hypothetical protein